MSQLSRVLVLGSGGREHALAWKLAQSPHVREVLVAPGNAGTSDDGKIRNVAVSLAEVPAWCKENNVDLVVVGPEDPLAAGIADDLQAANIACFGPSAAAAQLEGSKFFAKQFMTKHGIPTAQWKTFTDSQEACKFIESAGFAALVIKACGLAAGKGVVVAGTRAEACEAARQMLDEKKFGNAGSAIVVEELLSGEEISCLALTDGTTVLPLPPSQDHKQLQDGDQGPNTGGMGAYCPVTKVGKDVLERIQRDILQKTIDGMRQDGMPYKGVLYAGIMLTPDGPRVLEYNCRFGDPETQVILPLLRSDLYALFLGCVDGTLGQRALEVQEGMTAVGVVAVSGGYPGAYKKGLPIKGLDDVPSDLHVFHAGTSIGGGDGGGAGGVVTSGGRVLAVVAVRPSVTDAIEGAMAGVKAISFPDMFYRTDIAHKALIGTQNGCLKYSDSGVSIDAGDALVDRIKPLAKATSRPGCSADLGGFGGVFDLKAAGFSDPLLVSGTDGVGTKLKIAQTMNTSGSRRGVGVDLVAMCVNDVLCHGAAPLFFLDYLACGRLSVDAAADVVGGVAEACGDVGCALLGGETAEMPGMYSGDDYDVAGFAVGAVERQHYLPRLQDIREGDVLIGISSSGLHSNGFSLVRRLVEEKGIGFNDACPYECEGKTLGESLLTPTKLYVRSVLSALRQQQGATGAGGVRALAHVTGGGLPGNVCRVLPPGLAAHIDGRKWVAPPVFSWLWDMGRVAESEMCRTFNCGLGMVLVVAADQERAVTQALIDAGEDRVWTVGKVTKQEASQPQVIVENLSSALQRKTTSIAKKKVAVLISGSGTNLQALIDDAKLPGRHSEIVLVISNKPGVKGLERAQDAGIPTKVIPNKEFPDRATFDAALHEALLAAGAEIVCLAGFMRILTGGFVSKWNGRMINVHPALLPAFKGANAQRQALEARVTVTGCTVHFVVEEVDGGAILVQEAVRVERGDTEETLSEQIRQREHYAFPRALELVASGEARLGEDGKVCWQ